MDASPDDNDNNNDNNDNNNNTNNTNDNNNDDHDNNNDDNNDNDYTAFAGSNCVDSICLEGARPPSRAGADLGHMSRRGAPAKSGGCGPPAYV